MRTTTNRFIQIKMLFPAAFLLFAHNAFAQKNNAARYEIDAQRAFLQLTDDKALASGMEFEKTDSTYYVGYLYEGFFKYNHSADYQGYKNAIPALNKARILYEREFDPMLKNLFSSLEYLTANYARFQDYFNLCNALKDCYDNIEMPDSVMSLLAHLQSYHFKKDVFGIYYHRAWTYHRNRIFTDAKFSFLKNSINDNEQMAFESCYQGLAFINANETLNNQWFGGGQAQNDRLQIYHYLALLHCYNKHYDSSFYYYQILAQNGYISWNNYAGFQAEVGNFKNAQEFYKRDLSISYEGENELKEPYYYLPVLYVYAGKTKDAINLCNKIIQQNGSRPGFGWYNIALARSYLYDAQLDSAELTLNKAFNFKELHIGTTLTQQQYEFTINLLRVNLYGRQIEQLKFLHKNWWYSPSVLYKIYSIKWKKWLAEYTTCMELAFNPDRYRMVYDLFCSEATTTYDEAWNMLKDFSPKYFSEKYKTYQLTDKRKNIQRYFALFKAKFDYESGDYNQTASELESMLANNEADTENEKLYLGRLFEACSYVYSKTGKPDRTAFYNNLLLENYPQLIPFSGIKMSMRLVTEGVDDAATKTIVDDLHDVNINWTDDANAPTANILFEKRGDRYQATLNVVSAKNTLVITNEKLVFGNADNVAKELALRIFGKGGNVVFDATGYN